MTDFDAYAEAERRGWSDPDVARAYADRFAAVADQAAPATLEAAGADAGLRALDIGCGHGTLTRGLVEAGCDTDAVDASAEMLAIARNRAKAARFHEADAGALPFKDASFDLAVAGFSIPHMADQPKALAEARRVLRPGGRFAMTGWVGPDRSPAFSILYAALDEYADPDAPTPPPGPDFHRYASREASIETLEEAGFSDADWREVDCALTLEDPGGLYDLFAEATVRAAMLIAAQPEAARKAIREAMIRGVEAEPEDEHGRRVVPMPATLVTAHA
ncbi:MAG TPA: class I SAM-dependent methyltransferase [Paracoccaceae bacterium]|nr:class I SAM-dependent methyltransferase [Paracoccaceae bacterium]